MKYRLIAVLSCTLLVVGFAAPWTRLDFAQAQASTLDDRATRLRKDLGPFCVNFDFYFKHSFGNGEMRPVRCSRRSSDSTVVVAYAFSSRSIRDSWLNEWGSLATQRGEPIVKGRRWVVEVLQPRWEEEIRAELRD